MMSLSPKVIAACDAWLASSSWHTPDTLDERRFNRFLKTVWEHTAGQMDEGAIAELIRERVALRGTLTPRLEAEIARRAAGMRTILDLLCHAPPRRQLAFY